MGASVCAVSAAGVISRGVQGRWDAVSRERGSAHPAVDGEGGGWGGPLRDGDWLVPRLKFAGRGTCVITATGKESGYNLSGRGGRHAASSSFIRTRALRMSKRYWISTTKRTAASACDSAA